ncbi:hypothetical protein [Pelagimonas varians]|uniref:Uncharacterized protein n=1 Tax=Pelagimonas varians TaxID=696760 RepID=A0A238KY87_9RHOB|nr:hypothetical protein [Pelagimonas varians]PYG27860.1 hypothetical protein C8N36_114136 [Pelagimonas varians]SMX47749.1 hypothetical protein PEV8663_03634 [Pelagimonas varians]
MKTETRNIVGATAPDSSRIIADHLLSGILARELTAAYLTALLRARCTDAADQGAALGRLFVWLVGLEEDLLAAERTFASDLAFVFLGAGGLQAATPCQSAFGGDDSLLCRTPTARMVPNLARRDCHVMPDFPDPVVLLRWSPRPPSPRRRRRRMLDEPKDIMANG